MVTGPVTPAVSSAPTAAPGDHAPDRLLDTVSLYLHIPFCHAKCHYCDFNSYAGMLGFRDAYVDVLEREIRFAGSAARKPGTAPVRCRTIFFGGGTPSLLTAPHIARLLAAARESFSVDDDAEITLEANPGTLEYGRLDEVRATGVNRLSMGAQSFDVGLLKWMGRIHGPDEIVRAVANARRAGFDNLNLDFIYAVPGQTQQMWADTLVRAIALKPDHLSLYSLIVEEGTPLFDWVKGGAVVPADDDTAADMYEFASEAMTTAGYRQYEISNWAIPGHECNHNLTYWHNLPYIGLGAGAHGSFRHIRYEEVRPVREYIQRVAGADEVADGIPAVAVTHSEHIARDLDMAETAMLGLRLVEGLSLSSFERRFGTTFAVEFGERLVEVQAAGLLEQHGDYVRLTPRGRLLGNEVFARLLPDGE